MNTFKTQLLITIATVAIPAWLPAAGPRAAVGLPFGVPVKITFPAAERGIFFTRDSAYRVEVPQGATACQRSSENVVF